jgi:isopenicillin-N N-acyltransferase-like protein
MEAVDVIELHGDARERGVIHGLELADTIHSFYRGWVDLATAELHTSERDILSYAQSHLPASRAYAPDLVAEVEGIAEGSGMEFNQIFALNCFDEVMCHGPQLLTSGLHGCTAFAATGRATADGKPYIGQGWDMPRLYPPYFFRISGPETPAALVFSHAAIVGGTGINEHGLSLCWNTLKASDRGVGAPATFVVRRALQAKDISEMVGNAIGAQRANGMNFVLADSDQAVDLEMSATRYNLSYCCGVLSHANHYEAPELLQYEMDLPLSVPDTLLRSGRMRHLLEDRRGELTPRMLQQEVLTDHAGGPGSICRHECRGFETTVSMMFSPSERKVWATNGNPCSSEFVEYDVSAATAEDADLAAAVRD